MKRLACLLAGAFITVAGPALAQTAPALMAGMVNDSAVINTGVTPLRWCRVDEGPSTFQRDGTNPALVTLPYINFAIASGSNAPPTQYVLSGQAKLVFSTTNRGQLKFLYMADLPNDVRAPAFLNYSESFDAAQRSLRVRYTLRFPSCDVPVDATYQF